MLGEKLMKLRKKQGYSQQEAADILSVTRQSISNWECNQASPSIDKAAEMAKLYHVSLDDLVGDEVELITKNEESETGQNPGRMLKALIGKCCIIECEDMDLFLDIEGNQCKILDVNEDWLRVEYKRRKEGTLRHKETIIKLIDLETVKGFEIVEESI